jgi:response regulator RpfG family c-di-GMP phosphodiesterase
MSNSAVLRSGMDYSMTSYLPSREFEHPLDTWLAQALIPKEDWSALPESQRAELRALPERSQLLSRLVELRLLTSYQADRIEAGTIHGLVLGNYRVLDRLGAGGMGVVFLGEHFQLRRRVAIKVLPSLGHDDIRRSMVSRFVNEIRLIAQLQHPNIPWALDSGEMAGPVDNPSVLYYHVMEYVPGKNLEDLVESDGPMSVTQACDVIYQVASALVETEKHQLVHRDIKPSNILVTPEGQAKLLDFGLARHNQTRHTQPGVMLGTVDYISPEQVQDASSVDIRADLYGLGGTLYWCLTGQTPFSCVGPLHQLLLARLTQEPPSARTLQPGVPAALDAVIKRMMAPSPEDRYPCPAIVMRALLPFLRPEGNGMAYSEENLHVASAAPLTTQDTQDVSRKVQALIVDDEESTRAFCRLILEAEGFQCRELGESTQVLESIQKQPCDIVLLDVQLPGLRGPQILEMLRSTAPVPNLKIIMMSGKASAEEMSQMMLAGADDFLSKPLSIFQLKARMTAALRLKQAQDRADRLNHRLMTLNQHLEQNLESRNSDLVESRNTLVMALAELVTYRRAETAEHLKRMQAYVGVLACEMAALPSFSDQIDESFVKIVEGASPLHDIGMIGLPEHILLKPGKLDADERLAIQTHTTVGAEILQNVSKRNGFAGAFLQTAIDITRHHHERWDGKGYPDRLAGLNIPLAARIVALADVYDALRSRRPHKPALSHTAAVHVILESSPGQFDPQMLPAFERCHSQFDEIHKKFPD